VGFGAGVIVTPQIGVAVSSGPAAALQPIAAGASKILANLTELAVVEIATPLIAIILAIPVVVALLLFIITNSAYVVPPEGSVNPSSGGPYTGPLPEGCPQGWPTDSGVIRQGAWVNSSFRYLGGGAATHVGTEAIDDAVVTGTPVKATHRGVAIVTPINSRGYGNFIEVHSKCTYKGVEIAYFSRYAHLSSFTVSSNTLVEAGQLIGLSGNTGNSTGPHLHYEFRRDGNLATHYEQDLAPFMWPNFIPENPTIKRGCIYDPGNSYTNQCNASW
jgi:murein DD-endopeptidase MepM/ murein hydrolase activator NlpD